MATLTIEYPDEEIENREDFEKEVRFWVAVKLFDTDRVSLGKAAQICGMPKLQFREELGKLQIPVIRSTEEQMRAELEWIHELSSRTAAR